MVVKIKLADGKYCYAGPGCRLHSPTGIEAAKAKHADAMKLYTEAKSLGQMERAKLALAEAETAYDATTEGTEVLQKIINSEIPEFNKVLAKSRLQKAEEYTKKVEANFIKQPVKTTDELVNIELNNLLSPEAEDFVKEFVPTIDPGEGYMGSDEFIGGKLGQAGPGLKEIKQALNDDIKRAVKLGYLPGNLTYSLSLPGDKELRVSVRGAKDSSALIEKPNRYVPGRTELRPSEDAKELKKRLELITSAYNYDNSNPVAGYHNRTYQTRIVVESEKERNLRNQQARLLKERKIALQEERDFITKYKENKIEALNNVAWESVNDNLDGRVGRVPGTKIFIVDRGYKGTLGFAYTYLVNLGGKTEEEITSEQVWRGWNSRKGVVRSQSRRI